MVKYFRILGLVESASTLALFLIAMPLKYYAGMPDAVRVVGTVHGLLFLAYVFAALVVGHQLKWPMSRVLFAWFIACIPLGPILFEKNLFKPIAA